MKKNLIIKIIGLLVVVIVVGAVIFLVTLDVNQYKPEIVEAVSERTGRVFTIAGDLEVVPSLTPSIAASGITLGNADWGSSPSMLEVGRIEARVSLISLLRGEVHVNRFILHDSNFYLEKSPSGVGNWEFSPAEPTSDQAETSETTLPPVNIEEVEIRNALLSYRDIGEDALTEFRLREFTTAITSLAAPVVFNLEAGYNDVDLALSGSVGAVRDLLSGGEFPVDISGELGEVEFSMAGALSNVIDAPSGSVTLTLNVNALSDLNALSGSELPAMGPLDFNGVLNIDSVNEISMDEISLLLGEIGINGSIQVNMSNDVPAITARLQTDVLDLTPFMAEESESETEFLFSRDVLPLETLASVNADILFNASRIILPSIELEQNQLSVKLNNGNLDFSNSANAAGGPLTASLNLRTMNNNQARLSASINGEGIMLEQLPHEEDDRWIVGGATVINIDGSGSGSSVAEIMGSFNGKILVTVGEATIPNSSIELFGADIIFSTFNRLNPLSSQEDSSLLECAVLNLPIDDGMINLDRQIALQTSKMYMVGSGVINLKNEEINLGVRPYAKEGVGLNLSSVAGAAKIGGTLANPRAEIDAANAIKTGLSAGAAVATGGISLLAQGLFSKAGTDPEPCNTALGIVSQSPESNQDTGSQASDEDSSGGNVINDVKDTFRGLFGR